jgi:flagellar hook-associated protein 2
MATITASTGLVSGINYGDIINQLMALEQAPVNTLQTRIDGINNQKLAYADLSTRLASLQLVGTTLKKPSSFQNATTTTSDPTVLTATASAGAAVGSYQFQVAQLVTSQQSISQGFADPNNAKVGAGTLTLELGGGEVSQDNSLSDLRGGQGVSRGQFKITDRSGATAVIDTTSAVTLADVVQKINTSLDISVKASLDGDTIVLQDVSGKTTSNLIVQDVGDGQVASDLGIAGSSATDTIQGTDINYLGQSTSLAQVNDGRGIRTAGGGNDFEITLGDGSKVDVNVAAANTIGDVIDAINTAGGSKLKADIVPGANGIQLTDLSGGGGTFQVTALNGSQAANDLGIETTGSGGVIAGSPILAGLGTVLISSLNGGQGFTLGTISVRSRAAASGTDIDLSGAKSVAGVINTINAANAGVKASLNSAGDGIQIADTSGGTGNLIIGDTSGTTAADFGLAGTYDVNTPVANGSNLHRQWVSENTLLSDYNGGQGVTPGKFTITNSAGATATLDLSSGNAINLGDIIDDINIRDMGVTASINATGDGLLLTDTAGGAGKLNVTDVSGTMAKDLNIAGTATATTINGSMTKSVDVTANDTLATLQTKINALNFGVTASIINDGSASAPYRLALNATNSGSDGRIVIDAGTTSLNTQTLVSAQNAAVFVGGVGASQPLLITASKNLLSGVIKGVNITLTGVSSAPVTLNVSSDISNVVTQIQTFTQTFNDMIDKINSESQFDTTTNTAGLLLGDSTVQQMEQEVYAMLQTVNPDSGRYKELSDIGITLGDGAKIVFDQDKFTAAYAADPNSVESLFTSSSTSTVNGTSTTTTTGLGFAIENTMTDLNDPVNGLFTRENNTLDQRSQQFQDQITELNALIDQKRTRLQNQFANLESVLAGLQSQQQTIGQIKSVSAA